MKDKFINKHQCSRMWHQKKKRKRFLLQSSVGSPSPLPHFFGCSSERVKRERERGERRKERERVKRERESKERERERERERRKERGLFLISSGMPALASHLSNNRTCAISVCVCVCVCVLGSISSTFYKQLLRTQIPKAQNTAWLDSLFLCFWDLRA